MGFFVGDNIVYRITDGSNKSVISVLSLHSTII
jgi:hypothetical protein